MAMKYIHAVAPNTAEGLTAKVYPQIKKDFGALAEPFTLHSPSPGLLAGAFARFAAVIDREGKDCIPEDIRDCVVKHVQVWDGKPPGLGRHWVEGAVNGLDNKSKDIGRLLLLTAFAPYQVDEKVINAFTTHIKGDDRLLGALAWGCFTAVRRIGIWIGKY